MTCDIYSVKRAGASRSRQTPLAAEQEGLTAPPSASSPSPPFPLPLALFLFVLGLGLCGRMSSIRHQPLLIWGSKTCSHFACAAYISELCDADHADYARGRTLTGSQGLGAYCEKY